MENLSDRAGVVRGGVVGSSVRVVSGLSLQLVTVPLQATGCQSDLTLTDLYER